MLCPAENRMEGYGCGEALGRRNCKSLGSVNILLAFEKAAGR